jgi:uroporphyrinogen-III synthase
MALHGMRVLSFEGRRANEMAELIRRQGGTPFVAPAVREVPEEHNTRVFDFAERLFRGEYDIVVFLTGVGARVLQQEIATKYPRDRISDALRRTITVARGPKPAAALRDMGVPPTIVVPEPNTWREVLAALEGHRARSIAVQEYGRSNAEFLDGLRRHGAEVTPVRVYRWELPENTEPLREAAHRLANANADIVIFTTSAQIAHLMQIAAEEGLSDAVRAGFKDVVVASIGPTTTAALEEYAITPDLQPSHPKMGFLVKETAENAPAILARKRGIRAPSAAGTDYGQE